MPIGLEDRLINNASGFSIAGAIDNDVRGIYWVATTGARDLIGDADLNNSDLRSQYVICIVGSTPYIYTSSSIADVDWTNSSNWQEFALGDLTAEINARIAGDTALTNVVNVNTNSITQNAGDISTNAGAISTNASGISANAGNIANNAGDISTNAGAISTNAGSISTLQSDLAQEVSDRQNGDSSLLGQIQSNDTDISNNSADIATNAGNISANSTAIAAIVSADGSINTHDDVDTVTNTPEVGQVLFWNGQDWVPEHPEVTVEVKNATATNFTKGQPVYVSGTAASGKPEIELADNNGTNTYPAIGLLYDDIDAGAEGLVVISGSIFGLNTIGYAAGDSLYLDSTPGALTNTRPSGHTKAVQKVALVKRSHASAGSVIVMGAGRTNDVPNLQSGYFWKGDVSGVAQPVDFETNVAGTTAVTNNTNKLAGIDANATANPNALDNVVEDTTPELGGDLNLNGNDIIGSGKIDITGKITQTSAPTAAGDLTTKSYVDDLIAAGVHYHDPVRVESPDSAGSLNATYNNGTAGVGATLTNNGTQAALAIDGVTLAVSDRVLIYNQTNAFENGIYTVTNVGSAASNWVLTRATDADSYGLGNTELSEGTSVFVLEGDDGMGEVYVCNTIGAITFGTTAINFSQIGAAPVYDNATQAVDGLMSSTDKQKLDGIAAGAEVNVNADWNASGTDAEILNKPALFDGDYNNLTNVPVTFAPAAHTHGTGDITGFSAAVTARIALANLQDLNNVTTTPGTNDFLQWDGTNWVTAVPAGTGVPYTGATQAVDLNSQNLTGVNSITSSAALFGASPQNLRAFNIHGTGLNGRLSIQSSSGGAPGIELTTDGNASRMLMRMIEVGTDGTSLEFWTEPDGGSIQRRNTLYDDGTLYFHDNGSATLDAGLRNSSGTMQFKDSSGSWSNIAQSGGSGSSNKRTLTVPAGNDYSGDVVTFGSAPSGGFTVGELYYYANTGAWEEAYGTSTNTSTGMLGICVNTSTPEILVRGIITNSSYANQYTLGRRLYVSTLQSGSGRLMDAIPGSPPSGAVIRAVGYVINGINGVIMFDPSQDYITVT